MNTAASIALTDTPRPQQEPVSRAGPSALGAVVTVAQDAAGTVRRGQVSVIRQGARASLPGSDPSNWPDLVLERMFRQLHFGDLVECSQVCSRWRKLASDYRLQRHCLLRTYAPDHRLQMERALDSELVRASLMPWYDSPATEPEPGALASREPSSQELLCTALRRLFLTRWIRPGVAMRGPALPGSLQELLCSSDGRMIAAVRQVWGTPHSQVSLWEDAAEQVTVQPAEEPANARASLLAFSSDGGKLQVLYRDGRVDICQPDHEDDWYTVSGARLFEGCVHQATLSPDGRRLAVVLRDSVRIHGERAQGGWETEPEMRENEPLGYRALTDYEPDKIFMQFSADSRHFVLAIDCEAGIWTRQGEPRWIMQSWHFMQGQIRAQPAFDTYSRLLVVPCSNDSADGLSVPARLVFFRREAMPAGQERWQAVSALGRYQVSLLESRAHPHTGYAVPVTFSPDGELMAHPDPDNCQAAFVVFACGPDAWARGITLPCGATEEAAACELVRSLQFSASSQYLAVGTDRALVLWRRYGGTPGWRCLRRITPFIPRPLVFFTFSPDGFHCATCRFLEGRDRVEIWGPVREGVYAYKMIYTLPWGTRVEKMLFTPEATRFVIAASGREPVQSKGSAYKDFRLVSRLFYFQLSPSTPSWAASEPVDAGPVLSE
ncbi:MAG: F-box protein [Kistimonas sp.]|nr:F-box protein [Kistimonas sp.]